MYHTYHPQVRDIIHDMEYRAFQHFEDISRDVLNTFWKKNLKRKGLTWKVRHRGISSDGGCIQLSLTDEWGGPYMAWIPICPMRMFTWKDYTIELYVEGDRELAAAWRKHIEEEWLLLPADGEKIKAGTSRIFRYKVRTSKPFACMNEDELKDMLTCLYTEQLTFLFRMLIEHECGKPNRKQ